MTSSSSLYGSVTQQNSSSTNSTSLYGGADTPIPDAGGNVVVRGDLYVLSGNILTTATTGNIFPANATTVNLGASATAVNIGADTGTTTINNNLVVDGSVTAEGADFGNITIGVADDNTITTTTGGIKIGSATGNVGLIGVDTLYTDNTGTFNLLNSPTTIYAFDEATTLEIGASSGVGTTVVRNSFAVDGTQVGLAQGTTIAYSEANNRLNRPVVRSTTGNTSGFRVEAPNATTSASAVLSAFNTNDTDNGSFININARGNLTTPLRIQTGKYTSGVLGPSNTSLTFVDNITAYASLNPSGPTDPLDLTTKAYVDASTAAGVTSITGTADQVIASSSTGAVTLSLPQSIATTSNVTFADITATDDLTVQGNNVNLAPATLIGYSENNDRANRPVVRSTTGNSSGLRVEAPNATTSATSNVSAFSSNDGDNGKFINISARGAATTDLRIGTGKYTAGVLGPSGTVVSFVDNITTYATVNPSGPTNPLDLTTKAYVDALPANITYTIDSSATTGGANLNLVGSDATTDTIKFAGGTNVTVVATDANTITINAPDTNTTYTQNFSSTTGGTNLNLVGSDSTTDTVKFADGTGVTVSYTDANTATVAIGQAVGTTDNVQFNGVTTNSLTTGTVNANGGVSFVNTAPMGGTYATVNPFGPFNTDDLTTVGYVNSILPTVVTYTQDASATTGGANLNLVGSDATTDTVKIASGTGVTVAQTSANEISVAIGQSVATTADVTFNTVNANITDDNYVLGQLIATRNTAYVPPASPLTTIAGQNGFVVVSGNGGLGYAPNITIRQHVGDTTAGTAVAGGISMSAANGTNTAPTGITTNAVIGTLNYDGYTAGTSNNYANIIATTNQGAGTSSITPLQAQAYARQAFTNSTTVTTAVTGASGTGTTATLTFTLQNTAPYAVGQTVTVAGMTPSGYNGTYVITAATTSSISYANATTGFTTGGTIGAANTVTAAGMGFRIRGYANSTPLTVGNRFNFMDLTASAATFKSNTYTFANEVITGSTLTATNYMTLGATVGGINQDTFNIRNTAGTTTYGTFTNTAVTLGNIDGPLSAVRTSGAIAGARPVFFLRNTTTTSTTPATGDGASFRQQAAGSNGTAYNLTQISGIYNSTGDTAITFDIANGDQTGAVMTVVRPFETKLSSTVIKATATPSATAGANTLSTVAVFDATKITASVPIKFPVYTAAAANAITGEVGMQICISNSAGGSNPNGMMAFWDTTNARWSYIHDNSAV